MRICFICDTPYQLLNCINYVYHKKREENVEVDLYVGRQFKDVETVFLRLLETGLFNKCFMYETAPMTGVKGKIRRVVELRFPKLHVKRVLHNCDTIENNYEQIWCSVLMDFMITMMALCKNAELMYFDDGTGSYYGNINEEVTPLKRKIIYFVTGRRMRKLQPKALYVNNPELCKSKITGNILALPDLRNVDNELSNIINSVFTYHENEYYMKHKMIYLMQPNEIEQKENVTTELAIVDVIKKNRRDLLLRPHPRQKSIIFQGIEVDEQMDMWELVCAEQITDQHVLVGIFSTAQFIPKIIYDKEPLLIFTYRLYKNMYNEEKMQKFDKMIAGLQGTYSSGDKIMIPQNIDEFEDYIRRAIVAYSI